MSVRAIILLMVVGLCAATWWPHQGEAAQRARVLIRHASQLAVDKAVQSFVRPYAIFSAANVIYSQCGDELAIAIFHFGTYTIGQAKAHMAAAGIPMRLT